MKKLFGLALLALAFLAPDLAQAASRFAICSTTCTWDNTSTAMWSATSGGATGASAPVAGDDVTLDANTCVGGTTCTITTFAGTISAATITWGACTASTTGCIIDASVNNTNFTLNSNGGNTFTGSGSGTRKWLAGTGTYALTHTGANNCLTMATTTNDQGSVFSGATWSCSGNSTNGKAWNGGTGFTFGPTTINGNTSRGSFTFGGTSTFSSLTINGPNYVTIIANQTISGALTISGTSSNPVTYVSNAIDAPLNLSLGAASTAAWLSIRAITTTGASSLTGTNCLDQGRNTFANGGSCTAPVVGGSGGRIIGG